MKIIIVGGGFAGVKLALSLAHNIKFEVILVDKNSYNFFPPFLYLVTSTFFEPSQISNPFQELFSGKENLSFFQGELKKIIPIENQIYLDTGVLKYDYLVLATGTETNFSGSENVRRNAFSMKTIEDAMALRQRLLRQSEMSALHSESEGLEKMNRYVVAGGGSSGVEAAAMLGEIKRDVIKQASFNLSDDGCEIYLIQKDAVLLPEMPPRLQQHTLELLQSLGVKVLLNTFVKDLVNGEIILSSGETLKSENLVWTAGTKARKINGLPDDIYGKGDRIHVDCYNKVEGTYNIYAIGDICLETSSTAYPEGHPQVAQVAIQQGENLARNFQWMAEQKKLGKFIYNDPGLSLITGRMEAIAGWNRFNIQLTGKLAWMANVLVHWYPMTAHTNRFRMLFFGVKSYLFKQQSFRKNKFTAK